MIQAILFDSDGVLVDTERLFFDATRSAFESAGVKLSQGQWARWYLGESKPSLEIAQMLGIPSVEVEAIITKRNALFWSQIDQGAPVFPGVRETLSHLSQHVRLAIVTGASRRHFERVHLSTGLNDFFDVVVTRDDYEEAKPSPHAYQTALQKLSLKAGECLAVEDSPRGATSSVSAGVTCYVIPTPLTDISLCPPGCNVLNNLKQLVELVPIWGAD